MLPFVDVPQTRRHDARHFIVLAEHHEIGVGRLGPLQSILQRSALEAVNDYFAKKEKSDTLSAMNTFYDRAYSLVSSKEAREAFNIAAEPEAVRNEYGMNAAGQRMLMARRLVEAGARFVSLTYAGWDHHQRIFPSMRGQMPAFDQGFSTLIRDLDDRGMLDETLVMVSSESS